MIIHGRLWLVINEDCGIVPLMSDADRFMTNREMECSKSTVLGGDGSNFQELLEVRICIDVVQISSKV